MARRAKPRPVQLSDENDAARSAFAWEVFSSLLGRNDGGPTVTTVKSERIHRNTTAQVGGPDVSTLAREWRSFEAELWNRRAGRRRPKGGGDAIARDVWWLYLIRCCGVSVRQVARAYAEKRGRRGDCRSVVQDGVCRAAALLGLPSDEPPLP